METMVNDGYIFPTICGACLKLWVDDEPARPEDEVFWIFKNEQVPVRTCPRCNYEMSK